jgi:Leucine-rich repeat (LRR) protein
MSRVLTSLDLSANQISDISPLGQWAGSRNLDNVDLSRNKITDLSPLLSIANGQFIHVDVTENPFDCTAQASTLAALKAKLILVHSDCP